MFAAYSFSEAQIEADIWWTNKYMHSIGLNGANRISDRQEIFVHAFFFYYKSLRFRLSS